MELKNIETKKDLYIHQLESSTKSFFMFVAVMLVISIILAVYRLWLPLAVLFFSYLMGLFSGIEWDNFDTYAKLFNEKTKG